MYFRISQRRNTIDIVTGAPPRWEWEIPSIDKKDPGLCVLLPGTDMRERDDGGLIIQSGYPSGVPLSLALLR